MKDWARNRVEPSLSEKPTTINQRVLSVLENEILVGGRCVYLEWESGNEHPWESKNFYALFSSFLDDNADFIDTAIKVKPY